MLVPNRRIGLRFPCLAAVLVLAVALATACAPAPPSPTRRPVADPPSYGNASSQGAPVSAAIEVTPGVILVLLTPDGTLPAGTEHTATVTMSSVLETSVTVSDFRGLRISGDPSGNVVWDSTGVLNYSTATLTLGPNGERVWHPRFTVPGYGYYHIRAYLGDETITGRVGLYAIP